MFRNDKAQEQAVVGHQTIVAAEAFSCEEMNKSKRADVHVKSVQQAGNIQMSSQLAHRLWVLFKIVHELTWRNLETKPSLNHHNPVYDIGDYLGRVNDLDLLTQAAFQKGSAGLGQCLYLDEMIGQYISIGTNHTARG